MRHLLLSVTSLALLASSVIAQDSPLENFTNEVGVVVRLKSSDRTIEKVVGLVNQIQPGAGSFVEQSAPQLGMAIANPTLTGVDQTRDWYVGIYPNETNPPIVVFAIPATNTDDMVDALGDGFTTSVKGDWVIYAEEKYEIPTAGRSESVLGKMEAGDVKTFDEGDLSVFVNVKVLTEVYQEEIETGYEQVLEQINNIRFAMPPDVGFNPEAVVEMYGSAAEAFFSGLKDSTSFTFAISLGPEEGVTIHEFVNFGESTGTGQFFTGESATTLPLISKLEDNSLGYYGLSGGVKEMAKWGFEMSASMMQEEADKTKLKEVMEQFEQVDFGSMVVAVNLGNLETGLMQMSAIAEATPTDTVRKVMREATVAASNIEVNGMKQEAELLKDAETYGDYKADVVKLKQTYDEEKDPSGIQQKTSDIMFGPNGAESRILYTKDAYLTTMGGGEAAMKKLVSRLDGTRTNSLDTLRKPLLEKVNFLGLFDLARTVAQVSKAASQIEGFPFPLDSQMIDNLNLMPSYIGISAASEPHAVKAKTNVSVGQMQSIAKLVAMFTALQMQR